MGPPLGAAFVTAYLETLAAESAAERSLEAAQATTGEVLPEGRSRAVTAAQFAQSKRAVTVGVSRRQQQKLDALARRRPDLLDEVRAGRISVHGAALAADIVQPPDPLDQLRRLWRSASPDQRQAFQRFIALEPS